MWNLGIFFLRNTRTSAGVAAVAGAHAPARGEGVQGLRRWLGDLYHHDSQLLLCVEGSKTVRSGGKDDDTNAPR